MILRFWCARNGFEASLLVLDCTLSVMSSSCNQGCRGLLFVVVLVLGLLVIVLSSYYYSSSMSSPSLSASSLFSSSSSPSSSVSSSSSSYCLLIVLDSSSSYLYSKNQNVYNQSLDNMRVLSKLNSISPVGAGSRKRLRHPCM